MTIKKMRGGPVVALTISGLGVCDVNSIETLKYFPFLEYSWNNYLSANLNASCDIVGIPQNLALTRRHAHRVLTTGRSIEHKYTRMKNTVSSGSLKDNPYLQECLAHIDKFGSNIHLVGLFGSDKYDNFDQILSLISILQEYKISEKQIFLHVVFDEKNGEVRDMYEKLVELEIYLKEISFKPVSSLLPSPLFEYIEDVIEYFPVFSRRSLNIATSNWKDIWKGTKYTKTKPFLRENHPPIVRNDCVLFFNFLEERLPNLVRVFERRSLRSYLKVKIENLFVAGLSAFDYPYPKVKFFRGSDYGSNISTTISLNKKNQLKVVRTEQYADILGVLNGSHGVQPGEDRIEVRSSFLDDRLVLDILKKKVEDGKYDFVFANISSIYNVLSSNTQTLAFNTTLINDALKDISLLLNKKNGALIVTSDCKKLEQYIMINNGVKPKYDSDSRDLWLPTVFIGDKFKTPKNVKDASILDFAPSVLDCLDIHKPVDMLGRSLIST